MVHINDLPEEVLLKIFSHFSVLELTLQVGQVCSLWERLVETPQLYQEVFLAGQDGLDLKMKAVADHSVGIIKTLHLREMRNVHGFMAVFSQQKCPKLQTFVAFRCSGFTSATLEMLINCAPDLEHLVLWKLLSCPLVMDRKFLLGRLHMLVSLELALSPLDDFDDDALRIVAKNCPRLQNLRIAETDRQPPLITDKGLCSLFAIRGTSLRRLCLTCPKISDKSFSVIPNAQNLEVLIVMASMKLSHTSLDGIKRLRALQCLCLSVPNDFRSFPTVFLDENFPDLQVLSVDLRLVYLPDSSVHAIASNCPGLKALILSNGSFVTHEGISIFLRCCQQLEELRLDGFPLLKAGFLAELGPSLRVISVRNCPLMEPQFREFSRKHPTLVGNRFSPFHQRLVHSWLAGPLNV